MRTGAAHTILTKGLKVDEGVLMAIRGPNAGREYVLVGHRIVLGRADNCDITLRDTNVSREHATISNVRGEYLLADQKSKNGTFVNNNRVQQRALKDGDIINIGESLFRFRFGRPNTTRSRAEAPSIAASPRQRSQSGTRSSDFHANLVSKKGWLPKLSSLKGGDGFLFKLAARFFGAGRERFSKNTTGRHSTRHLSMFLGVITAIVLSLMLFRGAPKKVASQMTTPAGIKLIIPSSTANAATRSENAPRVISGGSKISLANKSLARERYSQAMQALDGGDYRRAMGRFEEVMQLDPQHPVAQEKREVAQGLLKQQIEEYYNSGLREYAKLYYDRAIREWEKSAAMSLGFTQDYYEKSMSKIHEAQEKLLETR